MAVLIVNRQKGVIAKYVQILNANVIMKLLKTFDNEIIESWVDDLKEVVREVEKLLKAIQGISTERLPDNV